MITGLRHVVLMLLILVFIILFTGCQILPTGQYVQDKRTDLCFYVSTTYGGAKVYSNVPCTEKVLASIIK